MGVLDGAMQYKHDSEENCKMEANREMLNSDMFLLVVYDDRMKECKLVNFVPDSISERGQKDFFLMIIEAITQELRGMNEVQ